MTKIALLALIFLTSTLLVNAQTDSTLRKIDSTSKQIDSIRIDSSIKKLDSIAAVTSDTSRSTTSVISKKDSAVLLTDSVSQVANSIDSTLNFSTTNIIDSANQSISNNSISDSTSLNNPAPVLIADTTLIIVDSVGKITELNSNVISDTLPPSVVPAITEDGYLITLQQAVDSALKRNLDVRQASLQTETSKILLNQASSNMLPSVFSNVNKGVNFGRNVDPFTNTYVTENINYGVYGLSSTAVLFNGMNLRNTRRQNQFAYEASKTELQGIKQEAILNVILAYFRVLNVQEQLQIAKDNYEITKKQVSRLELMESQGVVAPSLVTDIRGAMHKDEVAITNLSNQAELFKLQLAQQMNIPYRADIVLSKVEIEDSLSPVAITPGEVNNAALNNFPEIRSAELQRKSAEYALKAVRGQRFPTVTLGTNVQTLFTSSAQSNSGKIPFSQQVRDNRYTVVNLGIRIPIFMANTIRNNIKLATINLENSALYEERVKTGVQREIEQAYLEMTNAYKRFQTIANQLNAYRTSFRAAEARFLTGLDSSFDYMMAKDNLDQANANFINAKYDYLLRIKILEYYQNREL